MVYLPIACCTKNNWSFVYFDSWLVHVYGTCHILQKWYTVISLKKLKLCDCDFTWIKHVIESRHPKLSSKGDICKAIVASISHFSPNILPKLFGSMRASCAHYGPFRLFMYMLCGEKRLRWLLSKKNLAHKFTIALSKKGTYSLPARNTNPRTFLSTLLPFLIIKKNFTTIP